MKMFTMDQFIEYLKYAKEASCNIQYYTSTRYHIIIGNESCDLDSMVSALALGYLHYYQNTESATKIIPILNINFDKFPIRIQNIYLLKKFNVDEKLLVFRNHIDLQKLKETTLLSVSLVDHHTLRPEDQYLKDSVIEIFDHRPVDNNAFWNRNQVKVITEQVGSCCSLITNEILQHKVIILNKTLAALLNDVIIFDTVGFDVNVKKYKQLDVDVSEKLKKQFKLKDNSEQAFNELWDAYNDVSNLTPKQLLYKDLKIVKGTPVCVVPMLVKQYLKYPCVVSHMLEFSKENGCFVIVIIGLHIVMQDNCKTVHRDFAIFNHHDGYHLIKAIVRNLEKSQELKGYDFELESKSVDIPDVTYFIQKNIKLTRKHLLPLIEDAILQNS